MKIEYRSQNDTNTVIQDNTKLKVRGTVNKSNEPSKVLKDKNGIEFVEIILPDTFQKAIEKAQAENKDIKLLVNHDETKILARTGNGSLMLEEKDGQTVMSAELPNTTLAKDIYELVKEGLSFGMSFGFEVAKENWTQEEGLYKRVVSDMTVTEISILTIDPAYNGTEVQTEQRSIEVPKTIKTNEKDVLQTMKPLNTLKITNPEESLDIIIKEERALQTTANGSAVIPTDVAAELVKRIENVSPVFAMARKYPSNVGTLKVAKETEATMQAGFVGEGADIAELATNFEMIQLTQKRVGGYITLSQQLINDSAISMDDYVPDMLSRQVAKAVEKSILVGVGGTEFAGITSDKTVQTVEVTGALTIDSLIDLYLSINPEFLNGSAFIMQTKLFKQVAKLKDGNGQPYLQNGVVNGAITHSLFGMPVFTSDALTDNQPIVFGNIENAVSVMIKQEIGLQQIVDSALAIKGAKVYVLDAYMDAAVVNSQAVATLKIAA